MLENYTQNIKYLNNSIEKLKKVYNLEKGKEENIKEEIEKIKSNINNLYRELDILEKVNILLQKTSEYAREQSKKQIELIVTNCLQYVFFDSDIEFKIDIQEAYGKPNAEFYVISRIGDKLIKTKPELSRGGGVVDIISLALRIAFMQIHKPTVNGPLLLDEPAKHVSSEYIFNVAEFLRQTSEMFNRQIILVTHNNHLSSISKNAYRIEIINGVSRAEKIEQI